MEKSHRTYPDDRRYLALIEAQGEPLRFEMVSQREERSLEHLWCQGLENHAHSPQEGNAAMRARSNRAQKNSRRKARIVE